MRPRNSVDLLRHYHMFACQDGGDDIRTAES